ncbi:GM12365 [Drosophila sechellia]|uniref:GM12365 n=1 Tax=Drosophila sechellia TaxID=7238 RepID=B4I0V6_DROSE|nr:GM12365 [Drosophila sechellia]
MTYFSIIVFVIAAIVYFILNLLSVKVKPREFKCITETVVLEHQLVTMIKTVEVQRPKDKGVMELGRNLLEKFKLYVNDKLPSDKGVMELGRNPLENFRLHSENWRSRRFSCGGISSRRSVNIELGDEVKSFEEMKK